MAGLYHYTTGAGLLGMLKDYSVDNPNLTMRATHYMYMNDPKEYIYGQELCLDIIEEIEEELGINEDDRIKKIVSSADFQKVFRVLSRRIRGHIPYLISLSHAKDSLHMWSMYANGNGIAIRFNEDKLGNITNLKECIYYQDQNSDELVYNRIKQDIRMLYEKLNSDEEKGEARIQQAAYISTIIFNFIGTRIKHPAYKNEQEVRITPRINNQVPIKEQERFRDKDGLIIPFIEFKIPFDIVESIMVGPTADFNRVKESILLLLSNKEILWDEDRIIQSEVPYRL